MRSTRQNAARAVLIVVLVLLSIGLIGYSVRAVSFRVGSKRLGELSVTELSLTHSIQRDAHGAFYSPSDTASEEELAARKTSKGKVGTGKVRPKPKPAPKKPSKPKGSRACPT